MMVGLRYVVVNLALACTGIMYYVAYFRCNNGVSKQLQTSILTRCTEIIHSHTVSMSMAALQGALVLVNVLQPMVIISNSQVLKLQMKC